MTFTVIRFDKYVKKIERCGSMLIDLFVMKGAMEAAIKSLHNESYVRFTIVVYSFIET